MRTALDLCTGSGVHALIAAGHCEHVIGVDINPRAIAFAEFNQQLNGIRNVEFMQGDLYQPVVDRQFDLILANPPYNPDDGSPAGANFWSGGPSGTELLARVVAGLGRALSRQGIAQIITLFPNPPGATTADALTSWLGDGLPEFDVWVTTVPAPWWPVEDRKKSVQNTERENIEHGCPRPNCSIRMARFD
jgi:hypothetical protein